MLKRAYDEKIPRPRGPLAVAIVAGCALVTVLACNWAVGRFLDAYTTNLGYRYIARAWRMLGALDEPVDWLMLGDSSGAMSYDPKVVRERTGKRSINLATIGSFGLSDDAWMLEEYIEEHGAPEAVILVHVYDAYHRGLSRKLIGRIPRGWVLGQEVTEAYELTDAQRWRIFLDRYVRTYAERGSLRSAMEFLWVAATGGEEALKALRAADPKLPPEEPVIEDTGFVRMCGALPERVREDMRRHVKFLRKATYKLSDANRKALRRIAKLSRKHRFDVYIFNGPLYEELYERPAFQKYRKAEVAGLRKLLANYKRVRIMKGIYTAPIDRMQNVDHMICDETAEFTQWLVEQIQRTA